MIKMKRVFSVSSPPALLTKLLFPPPLADMLSWALWFKFLLNKVIANTCLFILTSFSKQSASWKVLEICELCALSTDSRKTYSVIKYMYTGSSSYSFDWGGGNNPLGGGGRNGKDPMKMCRACVSSSFRKPDKQIFEKLPDSKRVMSAVENRMIGGNRKENGWRVESDLQKKCKGIRSKIAWGLKWNKI